MTDPQHERRWLILVLIGIAQLMVVLDVTIVNIALPSAQSDLGFADDARQWVVTAYALAFGSLLLFGGRLGDLFGRKWALITGLLGFGHLYDGDASNACRFEDAAGAVRSGRLLANLWSAHPNLKHVGAFASVEDKVLAVTEALNDARERNER